jgi:PTS system fructose-specific IIA component
LLLINQDLVLADVNGSNELDFINILAHRAERLGYLSDVNEFIAAVKKREEEFSTAFGYGVAIPHGESDTVESSFLAFCRPVHQILWGDKNRPVQLIFMIGVPASQKSKYHLKILAHLSRKLLDESFRETLLQAKSSADIFLLLTGLEREITAS